MIALMERGGGQRGEARGAGFHRLSRARPSPPFFPRWYHAGSRRGRSLVRGADARPADAAPVRPRPRTRHGHVLRLRRADAGRAPFQHVNPSSTNPAPSLASIARSTCPAMTSMTRSAPSSIWRSAISSQAISASRSGACWAASSACASATTGAGPETYRVMGLQGGSRWSCSVSIRRPSIRRRGRRESSSACSTTASRYRGPAPTRTRPGSSP